MTLTDSVAICTTIGEVLTEIQILQDLPPMANKPRSGRGTRSPTTEPHTRVR
jgi:hypothetical protein